LFALAQEDEVLPLDDSRWGELTTAYGSGEAVCDRVAILCRGRLVALDSPLNLRRQHRERKIDAILQNGDRCVFDLDREEERYVLAGHVGAGQVASLQAREFDFHEVFLKLTGTAFD
jgi:ABC-2 type transport system ATP-binding protein